MLKERAITPEQKKEIINSLYKAWLKEPDLRFGQFLFLNVSENLFYIEDYRLKELVEADVQEEI